MDFWGEENFCSKSIFNDLHYNLNNLSYEELLDLYEILELDDDEIFKWYSNLKHNKKIKKNKVSELLKNFKL